MSRWAAAPEPRSEWPRPEPRTAWSGQDTGRRHRGDGEPASSGQSTGRRHRPDGEPPSWSTRSGAAPNGVPAADLTVGPSRSAAAGPPRFDDTAAYAGWLSGRPAPDTSRPTNPRPANGPSAASGVRAAPSVHEALSARPSTPLAARSVIGPVLDRPYADPFGDRGHEDDPAGRDPWSGDPYADSGYPSTYADRGYADGTYADRAYAEDRFGGDPQAGDPYADPYGDDDEPPGRHRRLVGPARNRRPRWVRTLGWVGAFLGILLVAGGGFAAYQYKKLSGNITRVDALAPTDGSIRDAAKQLDAENYLLIGSDSRDGDNAAYGTVRGARSDTTILAHLSPKRDKAVLISFPRDSWVSLPDCPKTGGGTEAAHDGQFNEAFTIGGPSCTVLAVQKLTGVKINHYVQVDFTGFKTMVDALNGVPICTPTPLRDDESGLRLPAGTTTLKGEEALAFVRARYGIGDGSDLGRIQRQQSFLGAMVRAATGTKLLVNPVALTKFLGAATKSLTLDRDTSFGDLKQLADQLHGLDPKKVSFVTAPIADAAYTPPGFPQPPPGRGGSRVLLDEAAGRVLYDSIINDKPAAPKSTTPPGPTVLTVAPAEVSVRVLNGVGAANLGRTVSTELAGVGFSTVTPSNAPATTVTTVRYGPDDKDEALTLAAAVPGAVLQPDANTDLDLVVGKNFTGVKQVKIGDPVTAKAATAARPTPAASTTTPARTAADTTCG
ncbi:MAG TPA: LCP family protein [Mycobacteriales bacterium]